MGINTLVIMKQVNHMGLGNILGQMEQFSKGISWKDLGMGRVYGGDQRNKGYVTCTRESM